MDIKNQPKSKKCPSCQSQISFESTKCPYCGKDFKNWFRRHPIISVLIGLVFLSNIIGGVNSFFVDKPTESANQTDSTPGQEAPNEVDVNQEEKTSWEIADNILLEQRTLTKEVHEKVANLVKQSRYQEAKDVLLQRQEEIITIMVKVKQDKTLSTNDKKRILESMTTEATGIAEEIRIIGEAGIDELLRTLD